MLTDFAWLTIWNYRGCNWKQHPLWPLCVSFESEHGEAPLSLLCNHKKCNHIFYPHAELVCARWESLFWMALKLQISQPYLTPSCLLSLCNIKSLVLFALYSHISHSSLLAAFPLFRSWSIFVTYSWWNSKSQFVLDQNESFIQRQGDHHGNPYSAVRCAQLIIDRWKISIMAENSQFYVLCIRFVILWKPNARAK